MAETDAYDERPYDDRPVAQAHPDRLWVAARRQGIDAARPESARILELGCAHGAHAIPIAFALPDARIVAIDRSTRQIEAGRGRARALGLTNLDLRVADVMDLDLGAERFDYIVAHGLFSWVGPEVRTRILALLRRHLSVTGVAYISYNAMPAWGVRGAVRAALFELVGTATEPAERIEKIRRGVAALRAIRPLAGTAEDALVQLELEGLADKPDGYVLHEYLVPEQAAFWVREFAELARRAGLRYLGDVAPTGVDPAAHAAMHEAIAPLTDDPIGREQLADVVSFRQFRASLVGIAHVQTHDDRAGTWLQDCHFTASHPEPAAEHDPLVAALRERAPASVSFEALAARTSSSPETLRRSLARAGEAGTIDVHSRPLPVASEHEATPRASALSRFEARYQPYVTTPRHRVAGVDAFHAAVLRELDGTKDRDALAGALVAAIDAGELQLAAPAGSAVPTTEELAALLPAHIDRALARLHAAGLLVP